MQADENIPLQVCRAIADYIGGDGQDIALTQNTTTGLALLYHGLPLREGDEILTTTHDHYVHHESIRLATGRCGATWRKIPLFDSYDSISPDEIAQRIRKAIGPKTRAVGVTWVHSSSGVRLPIARIAETLAEVNRSRDEKDRVLLIVDGVHGFGVEDPKITALGCDAFAAGTHKWLFGPRGTGFVWAKPEVWKTMRPVIPSFSSPDLFAAWEEEHEPAPAARAAWFSPGGFQAFEHFWALPQAIRFHQNIGPARITARTHELNAQMKEGLAGMPRVQLYTPRDENLSAGMVCFDVKGTKPEQVVSVFSLSASSLQRLRIAYRMRAWRAASSTRRRKSRRCFEAFVNWRKAGKNTSRNNVVMPVQICSRVAVRRVSPALQSHAQPRVSQRRGYSVSGVNASMNSRGVSALSNLDRIVSSFTSRASVPTQTR